VELITHPTNVENNNVWSYTPTLPYAFVAWYKHKHTDNVYFPMIHSYAVLPLNHDFAE